MSLEQKVYLAKEEADKKLNDLICAMCDMYEEIDNCLLAELTEDKLDEYLDTIRYMISVGDQYLTSRKFKEDQWETQKEAFNELKRDIKTYRREQLQQDTNTENSQTGTKRARLE